MIGSWLYDQGFKEKLGLSTDFVKAGAHADLGFGFSLPIVGGLPDRDVTPEERARVAYTIKSLYREFVEKVAWGRHEEVAVIDSIAQGRVWSGSDALRHGLVDMLGSLSTAISVARERAGIRPGEPSTVVEYPPKGLFDFSAFVPRLIGVEQQQDEISGITVSPCPSCQLTTLT